MIKGGGVTNTDVFGSPSILFNLIIEAKLLKSSVVPTIPNFNSHIPKISKEFLYPSFRLAEPV